MEADAWRIAGERSRRQWESITSTTIGEWIEILLAFAVLPAQLASYILPLYFFNRLFKRFWSKMVPSPTGKENRQRSWWGTYLIVCGLALVALFRYDHFMLFQGSLELVCGIAIFALDGSWWAPLSPRPVSA
jgi:hypothetical protein